MFPGSAIHPVTHEKGVEILHSIMYMEKLTEGNSSSTSETMSLNSESSTLSTNFGELLLPWRPLI